MKGRKDNTTVNEAEIHNHIRMWVKEGRVKECKVQRYIMKGQYRDKDLNHTHVSDKDNTETGKSYLPM